MELRKMAMHLTDPAFLKRPIMNGSLRKWAPLAILILVLATASGLLLRGNAGANKQDTGDEQTPRVVDAPRPVDASRPAAKPGDGAKTGEDRRQLLETVGALTAAHCYQTYLNIGLIADGRAKGTYSEKDAYRVLDSVLSFLDSVDRKLAALQKLDLDKLDRDSLDQMRALSALLRQQGKELQNFWDSGKDDDAAKYENVRKDSWAALSRLLGIGR